MIIKAFPKTAYLLGYFSRILHNVIDSCLFHSNSFTQEQIEQVIDVYEQILTLENRSNSI